MESPNEITSEGVLVVNAATLRSPPKVSSRYPSVKNLKILFQKYDLISISILYFTFPHHSKTYKTQRAITVNQVKIRLISNDAQFAINKGVPIPLSKNLSLKEGVLKCAKLNI